MNNFNDKVSFIWSVADLLRGPYKPAQYGDVMLPLVVLRRLDCVLDSTKPKVLERFAALKGQKHTEAELDAILNRVAKQQFHNRSKFDFEKLKGDPAHIRENLLHYIGGFSKRARDIFAYFGFEDHLAKLEQHNRLYLVVAKFAEIDLHPEVVSDDGNGLHLRGVDPQVQGAGQRGSGRSLHAARGDPSDGQPAIRSRWRRADEGGRRRTLYDPASGTGGMLSVGSEYLHELNPDAQTGSVRAGIQRRIVCDLQFRPADQRAELDNIEFGDTFTQDGMPDHRFDYMLANPPFGVEWKPEEEFIRKEAETQGFGGRFGAGLPRINDGSFLFLQHMISKMKPVAEGGSRLGIVFNGSPLFTGDAGSGESNIRKWIIEHDWLDAIVALPDQLFYNTGISTYLWIVTNRKRRQRKGKVQLINAVSFYQKMRKSLGNKRNEITDAQIQAISRIYGEFAAGEYSKIFDNADFGFWQITVERPLRLNFQASPERIERLQDETAFVNLATSKKKGKAGRAGGSSRTQDAGSNPGDVEDTARSVGERSIGV